MSRTILGMPVFPIPDGYVAVGCLLDEDQPDWLCEACEDLEFE